MTAAAMSEVDWAGLADRLHLLVVDDDTRLRALLGRYLGEQGHIVTTAASAADARALMRTLAFDLLVLDVMMPGQNGLELARDLRGAGSTLPILMLTARAEADERIAGLEAGADDYLPKPFEPRELLLRIAAIMRRVPRPPEGPKPIRLGRWRFDPDRSELIDGAETVRLTDVETSLLSVLAETPGGIVTRDELVDRSRAAVNARSIDVQVNRLRRKIEVDPKAPRYLQTVRGSGYVLRPD
jgi:two-component system, OmpR family, phosphate regulon response regulator OmpR